MNLAYYPGCTLKNHASHFEQSAIRAMEKLGMPMTEMKDWVCCGTVYSQTTDDLMLQLASIRNLLRAESQGIDELAVLCSMCYNTIRRAKDFIDKDKENLRKVNQFMYKEPIEYSGRVKVTHLLPILRDRITFEKVAEKVVNALTGLKVGAYYGCLLVRPEAYAIDDFEDPSIIEDLFTALGADSRAFPYRLECCGAYQTITRKDVTAKRTYELINSAWETGCETIVTSCPLCAFNLDQRQKLAQETFHTFRTMPVFYFTELMSIALGGGWDEDWVRLHEIDPRPLLREKGLLPEVRS